ncbi:MAG: DUF1727 domain-containing protein [Solirubrobacteraceae bacterium]
MAQPNGTKLALARLAGRLVRLAGGGATSAPGRVLLRLDPGAVGTLGGRLAGGSVLVSATNGKTTTSAMGAAILRAHGMSLVHNVAGANMAGGIASTLMEAARPGGGMSGELGLFEVDEMWLEELVKDLEPRLIVLGNLLRDQLDRYGELDSIAARWQKALGSGAGARAALALCADDPVVAALGDGREHVVYYGVEDESLALPEMAHAADAKHCRNCGAPYVFDAIYMAHLGRYRCASCGATRPDPEIFASDVTLDGVHSARFTLHTPAGSAEVALPLPGLYNVYNALAAAAMAPALGVPLETTVRALQAVVPAAGRAQSATMDGREVRVMLVKNPVGATEVLRTLALEDGEHDVLAVLNDNIADGRDVSWIWDADFELLAGRIRRATCSGTRASDMALRLKYAGVDVDRLAIERDLPRALAMALAERSDDADEGPLYVLPTYTAMLALTKLIAGSERRERDHHTPGVRA